MITNYTLKGQFSHLLAFMSDVLNDNEGGRQLSAGEPGRQKRRYPKPLIFIIRF